jgi:hypothetical protein
MDSFSLLMDLFAGVPAGAGVFYDILTVRESYALGSHTTVFLSEAHAIAKIYFFVFGILHFG